MGAKLSGDWRGMKVGGRSNLELVGILAVNVPGFPVPRPQVLVADGLDMEEEPRLALVAAGIVPDPSPVELRSRSRALAARVSGGLQGLLLAAGFDESKHPRNAPKGKDGKRSPDDGGKFTSKGGSGGGNVKDSLSAVDMGDKGKWEVQGDKLMHMPAGSDTWEMAANTDEFLEGAKPGDVKVQKNGSIMVYDDEVGAWEEAGHVDDFFEETKPSKAKAAKPLVDMSDAELREHRGALKDTQELKSIDSVIDIRTQEILKDAGVPKGKGIIDLSDAQLAALDKKLGPDADPQLKKLVQNTIKGRKGNP